MRTGARTTPSTNAVISHWGQRSTHVLVRLRDLFNRCFQFRCSVSFADGTLLIFKAKGGVSLISLAACLPGHCHSFIPNHLSSLSYYQNNGIKSLPCSITRIYRQIKSGACHLRRWKLHWQRGRDWATAQMHSEREGERGSIPEVTKKGEKGDLGGVMHSDSGSSSGRRQDVGCDLKLGFLHSSYSLPKSPEASPRPTPPQKSYLEHFHY